MTTKTQLGMTLVDFIQAFAQQPFELLHDEQVILMPNTLEHVEIVKRLYLLLAHYERTYQTIRVYSEAPFVLLESPTWVRGSRVPDLMIYQADRIETYKTQMPDHAHKPLVLVPDVCIEVISAHDVYLDVEEKVERYLEDGVRSVWVINPRKRIVTVYPAESNQITRYHAADHLVSALMPEFSTPVSALFVD
ncbi:MAG: Uma2 family endonuclease [Anaerolineae bacterium]|jgi:Uma2 family endonuclease|nr:Uma2 family endonuclease [Anaerolineae bacterium]